MIKKSGPRKKPKTASARHKKLGKVLHEFKQGKLKSGGGGRVKSRKQAIAIAMSEAGMARKSRKSSRKGRK